jgi:hypothetical protein
MKKIALESLFDSLDIDNLDEAKSQLHDWLVGEGKRIHAELNGIVESDDEEYVVEVSYQLDDQAENYQDHIETILQQKAVDVDHVGEAVYLLFYVNGQAHATEVEQDCAGLTSQIPGLQAHSKPSSIYNETVGPDDLEHVAQSKEDDELADFGRQPSDTDDIEEERVDELSRDTMKAYAKAARKDRDSDTSSDEKVGRRVAGLGLVADKARREKSALQYEADDMDEERVDELSRDTMKAYAKAARKDRDSDMSSDEKVGRRVAGLDMVADKARREKAAPKYESQEDDAALEEADLIADLAEAFAGLKTVSHKQAKDGTEVGDAGKVKTNTKSSLPMKKKDKREGGDPVEIKSDDHSGFNLESAPKVKDAPKKDVENAKKDPKKVTGKGGKALLNKKDGFGSDSPDSPISGKGL